MKKPLYKRELSHSYLVMEDIPQELSGHYQYRMILRNRIPGLLTSSERYMEGRSCLYYDISSRQSLGQMYLSAKIGIKEIRGIIDNLAQVLDTMSEYLLEERFLILEPEYIYMDLETEQLFFLYYPFQEEDAVEARYLPLAEFFLEHVDHREERAVGAAYQFYKMSKAENFMVGSFRTFLEKGLLEEREQEGSPAGSGRAEYSRTGYSWQDYSRPGYRREEFLERKYAPENVRSSERKAAACFYEEEGPYEYGAAEEDLEGKRYKEKEYKETGNKEEQGDLKQKRKKCRKAVGFLAASAIIFLLLCAAIWYRKPEGGEKTAMFGLLAADGLFLLVCLWKATAETVDETEEKAEEDEEIPESSTSFWEEYIPPVHEELEGPTVYLSRSGMTGDSSASEHKRPRLTGMTEEADGRKAEYSLERLPVLVGKLKSRAQILLSDASVSRIHARFVEQEGRTALIDLNSTNGTFINGVRLEQEEVASLEDGDELRFGNVRMKYEES